MLSNNRGHLEFHKRWPDQLVTQKKLEITPNELVFMACKRKWNLDRLETVPQLKVLIFTDWISKIIKPSTTGYINVFLELKSRASLQAYVWINLNMLKKSRLSKEAIRQILTTICPYLYYPLSHKYLKWLSSTGGFVEKFNVIDPNQFGLRKGKSTSCATFDFTQFLCYELDQNKSNWIFADLSKASAMVSNQILLLKQEYYGIIWSNTSPTSVSFVYQWFASTCFF